MFWRVRNRQPVLETVTHAEAAVAAAEPSAVTPDATADPALTLHLELTELATGHAERLLSLQHQAALEWLEAEKTLRFAEAEIAAPPRLPQLASVEPEEVIEPTQHQVDTRGSRAALIAASVSLLLVGTVVSLHSPAIAPAVASRSAAIGDVRGDGERDPATSLQVAVQSGQPPMPLPPADPDFGTRVYGRFAAAPPRELECLARAIYYEARGEPYDGKVAVAQVVLNRARSRSWPDTICGVVHQGQSRGEKCQFSYVCFDNLSPPFGESWDEARSIAGYAVAGKVYLRELEHATHYHTTAVKPVWRENLNRIATIGAHIFYDVPGGVRENALDLAAYPSATRAAPAVAKRPAGRRLQREAERTGVRSAAKAGPDRR